MKLIALYLHDYNGLTRREKARYGWYAAIIFAPLAAILLAHHLYGPGLRQIMGW